MAVFILLIGTLPNAVALGNATQAHNASNPSSLYRNSTISKRYVATKLLSGPSLSDYTRTRGIVAHLEVPANIILTDIQTKQHLVATNNSLSETTILQASLSGIGQLSASLTNSSQSGTSLVRNSTSSSASTDYSTIIDWAAVIAPTGSGGLYA